MSEWNELERLAEEAMPKCCGEAIPSGVEYGGQQEMMCCDAWQSDGEVVVNPFDLLCLIQENELLREERDSQQRVAIKALEENRRLNGALDAICAELPMEYLGPANGGINALAGDFARMARDAQRYRFVRDVFDYDTWEILASTLPDEWDATIDTSIARRHGDE